MRLTPLTALLFLACSTSSPTTSPDGPTLVGSSADALRQQRQLDADDVERCRDLAAQCTGVAGDAGFGRGCERISEHCDQLEEQLAADRAELEQCLEAAVACEAAADDPAECADERAACEPAERERRGRRGQTLECSNRAEQCIGRDFGRGRGLDAGDAGAVCQDGDDDFIGCCRSKHGDADQRGDAGADDRRPGFGFGAGRGGFGADQDEGADRDEDKADDGEDDVDAGRPRRRF